jgi:iron(III) transport system ATP-binding protein
VARFFSGLTEMAGQCRGGVAETALGRFAAPGVAEGPVVVAFRPRSINLCLPGAGVEGCVTACRYLGDTYRAHISLGAYGPFLELDIDVGVGPLAPGQTVGLTADPERALVYAVDDAPSSDEDRGNAGLFPPPKEKSL